MSFIQNKYLNWYYTIIDRACQENREQNSDIYERHHIVPRSLGGSDSADNLVYLTFREHYFIHLLLINFTAGKDRAKMIFALHTFFYFNKSSNLSSKRPDFETSSRLYERHKKWFIEACRERTTGRSYDKTIYHFKHKDTQETFSGTRNQFVQHSGLSHQEVYNLTKNESQVVRYAKGWGVYRESIGDYSFNIKRKHNPAPSRTKVCPHCKKSVSLGNFARWHGDNCKSYQ